MTIKLDYIIFIILDTIINDCYAIRNIMKF